MLGANSLHLTCAESTMPNMTQHRTYKFTGLLISLSCSRLEYHLCENTSLFTPNGGESNSSDAMRGEGASNMLEEEEQGS